MVTIGCNQISTTRVVLNYLKILIFFFNIEEKKQFICDCVDKYNFTLCLVQKS